MKTPLLERLAVCSWSLQPVDAASLIDRLEQTGVRRLQIALDPFRENPGAWKDLPALCGEKGITLVSGMFGTMGEDYSSLESIRRTGGVVPDATWEQNWTNIQSTVKLAQDLGLRLVTFHAGFLPHEETDPDFQKLLRRIDQIARLFSDSGLELGFETGQESADTLKAFLEKLGAPNVGVNFDPANMLLYDKGDPIQALRALGPWLQQCHIKDALRTKTPGTWGEEVVPGTGEVNWREFFLTAEQLGFKGDFAIEREAGTSRVQDIRQARDYILTL